MVARYRPKRCTAVVDDKRCAACSEDIKLEQEINELEIQIQKIQSRRRALRTAMNENHDPLIHKFPPEIASHIFMQYSPPRLYPGRNNPLYLGAVCQKWRQLAWATPELWTSLRIAPRTEFATNLCDDLPQLVNEWLERSASLPLAISVHGHRGWTEDRVDIVNKHSARWYDIEFDIPGPLLPRFSGSSQVNILRRLTLAQPFSPSHLSPLSRFSMKSTPSPIDLMLRAVRLPHIDIIWNDLTMASVDNIGVDDCLELIRRSPHLRTLALKSINPSTPSDVFPIPAARIVHPRLHSLQLNMLREETIVTILDSLCLPSLEQFIHHFSPFPLDSMIAFVAPSRLKIFKIGIGMVDYRQLITFLSQLSSLEFLELRTFNELPPRDELFTLLCTSAQSPLYLPHLRSLEFVCENDFFWESLPQIFSPTRWKSLRVKVSTRVLERLKDREIAKRLLKLVDSEGIDLSIINHSKKIDLLRDERLPSNTYS
ncbi:hypothetical protein M413DRAFT_439060 [Hebeloma cylindrosporum]|uniref:Uncharacterized protein n=1 Tax=Hebeloma cylindrosporum TaxID=76867 RepID=A0A0C3CF27_HEBCY|nr:hypothetical protein M413DRAFT_439060 [Hebeloma cylindrosporum h7]